MLAVRDGAGPRLRTDEGVVVADWVAGSIECPHCSPSAEAPVKVLLPRPSMRTPVFVTLFPKA